MMNGSLCIEYIIWRLYWRGAPSF